MKHTIAIVVALLLAMVANAAYGAACRHDEGSESGEPYSIASDESEMSSIAAETVLDIIFDGLKTLIENWPDTACAGVFTFPISEKPSNNRYAIPSASFNEDSTDDALQAAETRCRQLNPKSGGYHCVPYYFRYCGAMAVPHDWLKDTGEPRYAFASANTPHEAANAAKRKCNERWGKCINLFWDDEGYRTQAGGSPVICNRN